MKFDLSELTQLSAITFMACPAKLYATNWLYVLNVFLLFLIIPIVTKVFIPFYRRLDVTTAYEYLEKRFNVTTRLFGSVVFLLMQFGRLGIVLLLPSIALSVVTGINVYVCIAVMGVLRERPDVVARIETEYARSLAWCRDHAEACGKGVAARIDMLSPEAVARAARERSWLVLVFHQVTEGPAVGPTDYAAADLARNRTLTGMVLGG